MPPKKDGEQFPFVTRKMLSFEEGTVFAIRIASNGPTGTQLTIRGITKEGMFTFKHNVNVDVSNAATTFRIPDLPILISVGDESGNISQGNVYASLSLIANGQKIYNLCSGLVYNNKEICWPISTNVDKRPGGGIITYTEGTDPAAGAEIDEFVVSGQQWRIIAIAFTLVTDANVANRRVHLKYNVDGIDIFRTTTTIDQTASTTRRYFFSANPTIQVATESNMIFGTIPENVIINMGQEIATVTINKQATDNYGKPVIYYERFYSQN